MLFSLLALIAGPPANAEKPPVPSKPVASCDATINGCYVNGSFTLTSSSSGADHYKVCRSNDTLGWGGCDLVMTTDTGSTYTVSGGDLPSDANRRAYRFKACDASNSCSAWSDEKYVYMDSQRPTAPGPRQRRPPRRVPLWKYGTT